MQHRKGRALDVLLGRSEVLESDAREPQDVMHAYESHRQDAHARACRRAADKEVVQPEGLWLEEPEEDAV